MMRSTDRTTASRDGRRAVLQQLRQVESALVSANALDRAARRIRNPRVAELLHERAEARRKTARWARAHLVGRTPCPDPAVDAAARIAQA